MFRHCFFGIKNIFLKIFKKISIGKNVRISNRVILKKAKSGEMVFGNNTSILSGSYLSSTSKSTIVIGKNVFINRNCMIVSRNTIEIGDNTIIGPNVKVFDHNHLFDRTCVKNEFSSKHVIIGNHSWIGANVVILKNAKIGNHCVIGAGVVIDFEVPDYSIVTIDKTSFLIKEMRC